ncbi:MAG: hypothetical protein FWE76_04160, partial [Symbiobacteriaceae bacterium]|nr:hypothetical protein [Symbiobacteriaceae bacterium]
EYNFELPPPGARERLGRESFDLLEEEKEISTNLGELSQHLGLLRLAEDYTLNALLRLRKSLEVTYSEATITIEGWIFADRRHQFEEMLTASFLNTPCSVTFSPIYDKDIPLVPIKLQNNRLVTPYESLTDMYSLPRYNEVDPTPVMTVFYQLFFGMMVADIGYGLTLFIIGQIVRRRMKLSRDTRSFIDFLYYLCFPIIGWGVVFGSFFGLELPFGLLSANTDIIPLTILSIVLGCLHIIAGLVLYMINQAKLQNYADMLSGGLSWILTFIGGGLAILVSTVPAFESAFFYWIGMGLVTIGVALIVFVPAIKRGKHWYVGIGTGLYALYGATSYIGDFISYTRLMALAVAGASVALAFNTILGFLPLPVRLSLGLVVAVILHALNIFLSMLSAYVHGIRLEFIEFFGKFYSGGGRKFDPFKTAEKNVIICDPVNTDN